MFVYVMRVYNVYVVCWSDLRNLRIDAKSIRFSDAWKIDIAYDKTAKVNVQKAQFSTLTHKITKKNIARNRHTHTRTDRDEER